MSQGSFILVRGTGIVGPVQGTARVVSVAAVAVAMMAAAPLSREFADKMAELSSIAPELSRLLADLTAVRVDFCFACMFSRLALCR